MKYTRIVAAIYGAWFLFWLSTSIYGAVFANHREFGISAQLWLILSGLPLSLISLCIMPNGSVVGVAVTGAIGLLQWCILAVVMGKSKR